MVGSEASDPIHVMMSRDLPLINYPTHYCVVYLLFTYLLEMD